LIASLFLTESTTIQTVIALIAFIIMIVLSLKTSTVDSADLNKKKTRTNRIEMMNFKRNKVNINENATDQAEIDFNSFDT